MQPLRIGFVGLGGICRQRHLPGLQRLPGIEIRAVANRTRESGERAASEFGIPIVFDSWKELVSSTEVDVVFIGTWPYLHKDISIAALKAGKHVFCQARMAMDQSEAEEMFRAASESNRVAGLCPVPIGLSIDATIRRLLQTDWLGGVRLVQVQSHSSAFADPNTPMNWRKDHRFSGLNMHTLGMYIEVMHRWFGWTHSVSATTDIYVEARNDATGVETKVQIPDQILCNARMNAGFPVQYAFSTVSLFESDVVWIHGANGTLKYEVGADRLLGGIAGQPLSEIAIDDSDRYDVANWAVERDFINAIREGTEYHPDFSDGLKYMQVVQAVYDSAAEGRAITLA
ncbi:MAG: Gfo/Idh/MocA family oxidoreductase [Candidatus Hydrogenedentales bacterium]